MTGDDVFRLMHAHFEGHFPKDCPACGRSFTSLRDYIINTERIGETIPYDAEQCNWEPEEPLGGVALSNCTCGNTLALTTKGLPLADLHAVLQWIKVEAERRDITPRQLADLVRDEVRRRALADGG